MMATVPLGAQVIETNTWTDFCDSASTFNGALVPVGSIVDAYDPDGVHCGTFKVHTTGLYGFMPVYGDEAGTGPDEGAEFGDHISFKINGRPATIVSGSDTWDPTSEPKQVHLSATGTILISGVEMPGDWTISPGETVTFRVKVRNDSPDGVIDMYSVTASNSHPEFIATPQDSVRHANPGQTVTLYFDITVPLWVSNPDDTVSIVTFSVYSELDPTQKVDGSITVSMSLTDVTEGPWDGLPGTFQLAQNYPNPFNPTTHIAFNLPARSSARLEIIDMLGRFVETRDLGILSAGTHELEYDGSALSSGVYFYRVVTEHAAKARKMVLLK
jgi:hypothetical protein